MGRRTLLTQPLCHQKQLRRLGVVFDQAKGHLPDRIRGALDPSLTCTVLSTVVSTE